MPDSPCSISFDTWSSKAEPFCKLPEVWLRVEGIPEHTIGDFLALWGLGTLFGKTLDVDMPYTRRHKVLRILIGCLDYTLIQERLDVFIKDGMYKLNFTVEAPKANQVVEDEIMGDADEDGEDKGEKGKEAQKEDGDNSNKPAAEKRKENEVKGVTTPPNSSQHAINLETPLFQFGSVNVEVLRAHQSWADMVEEEEDVAASAPPCAVRRASVKFASGGPRAKGVVAAERPWQAAEPFCPAATGNSVLTPSVVMSPVATGSMTLGSVDGSLLHGGDCSPCTPGGGAGSSVLARDETFSSSTPGGGMGSRPTSPMRPVSPVECTPVAAMPPTASLNKVITFGGIPAVLESGIRTSARLREQPNADAPILEKAMSLASRWDSPTGTSMHPIHSINSFSDDEIIHRASRIGISLRKNKLDAIKSVRDLKACEKERSIQILRKSVILPANEEIHSRVAKAIDLAEDLLEDGVDELGGQADIPIPPTKATRGRPKKGSKGSAVRRSNRLKKKNNS